MKEPQRQKYATDCAAVIDFMDKVKPGVDAMRANHLAFKVREQDTDRTLQDMCAELDRLRGSNRGD